MLADAFFIVLATVLIIAGIRGLSSGAYAFTHDKRLAVTRASEPVGFWTQVFTIFGTAALLLWTVLQRQ